MVYTVESHAENGRSSCVSRRFSEFEALHLGVRDFYETSFKVYVSNLPQFPPKGMMWNDQFNSEFIAKRRNSLQAYLEGVLRLPHAHECPALKSFLWDT